tara:strand:+ start:4799 stop:5500 length:702 start_codon:yes stop_codon:yes gene_type:complete
MVSSQFIELISQAQSIQEKHLLELDLLCDEHPYCASLHKIRLKALKLNQSDRYNKELKHTAALSGNRRLLFEYITQTVKQTNVKEVLIPKTEAINETPEKKLRLGKPLDFNPSETHSFSEWLKLAKVTPINRKEAPLETAPLKPIEKTDKIVEFIAKTVKKARPKKEFFSPSAMAKESLLENKSIMTETLAKVYLEQGHYNKAITAYEILSLKYPQKSGLFADQIKAIKQIKP